MDDFYAARDNTMPPLPWTNFAPPHTHCNVDRLWEAWTNGTNPSASSWLNESYVFADESGQKVEITNKAVIDTGALGYVYDKLPRPAKQPEEAGVLETAKIATNRTMIRILSQNTTKLPLLAEEAGLDLALNKYILRIGELSNDGETSTDFEVVVSTPSVKNQVIGSLNFFSAHSSDMPHKSEVIFEYDISEYLAGLESLGDIEVSVRPVWVDTIDVTIGDYEVLELSQ